MSDKKPMYCGFGAYVDLDSGQTFVKTASEKVVPDKSSRNLIEQRFINEGMKKIAAEGGNKK